MAMCHIKYDEKGTVDRAADELAPSASVAVRRVRPWRSSRRLVHTPPATTVAAAFGGPTAETNPPRMERVGRRSPAGRRRRLCVTRFTFSGRSFAATAFRCGGPDDDASVQRRALPTKRLPAAAHETFAQRLSIVVADRNAFVYMAI